MGISSTRPPITSVAFRACYAGLIIHVKFFREEALKLVITCRRRLFEL